MSREGAAQRRVLRLDPRDNALVALTDLRKGETACFAGSEYLLLSTRNLRHAASAFHDRDAAPRWSPPDVSRWREKTFLGYQRPDGLVGTRNYWIVLPLVFCENRNLAVLKQAFEEELGFAAPQIYRRQVSEMVQLYREGKV